MTKRNKAEQRQPTAHTFRAILNFEAQRAAEALLRAAYMRYPNASKFDIAIDALETACLAVTAYHRDVDFDKDPERN